MIKKLISLFLIVVFLIPNIVIADNALIKEELVNSLPREELINVAIERGAKKEELESMSIFFLEELVKDGGEIVSLKTTDFIHEDDKFIPVDADDISPLGTISTYDFTLTVGIVRLNSPGYDYFKFVSNGKWRNDPVWRLTDVIATSWSDEFTLIDSHCTYYAYQNGSLFMEGCTRNKIEPEAGLSHNVDLRSYHTDMEVQQTAYVRKLDSTGSLNVVTSYAHEKIGLSSITTLFGLSGKKPTIDFSAGLGSTLDIAEPDFDYYDY